MSPSPNPTPNLRPAMIPTVQPIPASPSSHTRALWPLEPGPLPLPWPLAPAAPRRSPASDPATVEHIEGMVRELVLLAEEGEVGR